MVILKSPQDLNQLDLSDPVHGAAREHFHRLADLYPEYGYLILIEKGDTEKTLDLPEALCRLRDFQWEGVVRHAGHYHAVYLTNNEFALEFIIPDADWLPEDLKKSLEEYAGN